MRDHTALPCRDDQSDKCCPQIESRIQDDILFEPGEGVEEFLQLLEAGKPLPPDPRQIGRPKESAQSFLGRMDRMQARYEAQFLKRKDWQVSPGHPTHTPKPGSVDSTQAAASQRGSPE